MFHTFESVEKSDSGTPEGARKRAKHREGQPRAITNACTSCRTRKIKCDGEQPCESCRWYNRPDQCQYSEPRAPHKSTSHPSIAQYKSILRKIFPNVAPENIVNLPRERLPSLMDRNLLQAALNLTTQSQASPPASVSDATYSDPPSNEVENLESLQAMPEEFPDNNPAGSTASLMGAFSDEVNALSLLVRQPSSYLGVSSVQAVLKVITWLDPQCAFHFAHTPSTERYERPSDWIHHMPLPPHPPPSLSELEMLDAYFLYFHPFAPMLDEHSFRETYRAGHRKDDHWLALLNIVLALGCIAATSASDQSHQSYFYRSMSHLSLRSLGTSNLESIQALGLIGGWYCHYISQPNMAYSLMGAALRMAVSLGLHREHPNRRQPTNDSARAQTTDSNKASLTDLKRRIWWSLFCLDTWACVTLGRPSMGRSGPAITVKSPSGQDKENILDILPLIENIRFTKIATEIQEALAAVPLVRSPEMSRGGAQLLQWWENLPPVLKDHEPCSEKISIVRTNMRWRYLNQLMLLYRPVLLNYAIRRAPYITLQAEECAAIEKCREAAEQTIESIAATNKMDQFICWNAVWMIFQATMVPLVGLFIHDSTASDPRASLESCKAQVETAMLTLSRMNPFAPTAKQSLNAISRIFEASKRRTQPYTPGQVESTDVLQTSDFAHTTESADKEDGLNWLNIKIDNFDAQYPWDYMSWGDICSGETGVDAQLDLMAPAISDDELKRLMG
ncbi:hypothetical protein N7510_002050 [Penicillium lagena]|uniref:uncharacterized protein n=1 Tax=Penicillium lagena TaxID=94218 RepID=UPI002540C7CC|nr:uncharacterized protein N7510_002050 [Penicillium lagena]KAJ5625741.1 hypothetical protein N7510_002050 [Penicillium lagena]